jgi:hypothetical protein
MTCLFRYAAIAHGPESMFSGRPIMELMKLDGAPSLADMGPIFVMLKFIAAPAMAYLLW